VMTMILVLSIPVTSKLEFVTLSLFPAMILMLVREINVKMVFA
jgi:hypothetical protein